MWIVGGLGLWIVLALLAAVVIGRGTRLADERSYGTTVDAVLPPVPLLVRR